MQRLAPPHHASCRLRDTQATSLRTCGRHESPRHAMVMTRRMRGVTIASSVTCEKSVVLRTQHPSHRRPYPSHRRPWRLSFSILSFDPGGSLNAPRRNALPWVCRRVTAHASETHTRSNAMPKYSLDTSLWTNVDTAAELATSCHAGPRTT